MISLNPTEKVKVAGAIGEITNAMIRAKAESDHINEICANIKEKYKILAKDLKNAAKFSLDSAKKDKAEQSMDNVEYLVDLVNSKVTVDLVGSKVNV